LKLDKVDAQNQGELTQPTLVLCEGKRDSSFVLHLAEQRGFNGIQIGFPDRNTATANGKDGFGKFLTRLRGRTGFKNLRHIVILRDRDNDDADTAFRDVVRQITEAGNYQVPVALEQESGGIPGITVRLIPDTQTPGNLDVLLLSAIDAAHPLHNYFECCNLDSVPVGKAAKIKLTTIVAASCQHNPSCSLVWVWGQSGNPIPLESTKFDAIADFFRRFV
jgi:hypothetical protein